MNNNKKTHITFSIEKELLYAAAGFVTTVTAGVGATSFYIFNLQAQIKETDRSLALLDVRLKRIEELMEKLVDINNQSSAGSVVPNSFSSGQDTSLFLSHDLLFVFKWLLGLISLALVAGVGYYVLLYLFGLLKTIFSLKTFFGILTMGPATLSNWFNTKKVPEPIEFVDNFGYTIKIIYYLSEKSFDVLVKAPSTVHFMKLEDFIQKLLSLANNSSNNSPAGNTLNSLTEQGALSLAESLATNSQALNAASSVISALNI